MLLTVLPRTDNQRGNRVERETHHERTARAASIAGRAVSAGGTVALRSRVGGALAKKRTKIALSGAIGIGVAALAAGPAGAQELSDVELLGTQVNLLWVVIGAVLVIFMQAGFALVETGFCRAKHAAHVVSTNFAIFGLGFVAFFLVGYPLMFGGYTVPLVGYDVPVGKNLIGSGNWVFLWQGGWGGSGKAFYTAGAMGIFLYMVAFMDTVATIPTGAMAERWKWKAFVGWGLFCGAIYYPLFGAWTWGGGWLAKLGESANLGRRLRRLRRFRRGARRRWCGRPGRGDRPRAPHRQVRQGRHTTGAARPPHPDGHARHVHPAVRLVRLQRGLDVRGHRHPLRRRRPEHRPRRVRSVPWPTCSG